MEAGSASKIMARAELQAQLKLSLLIREWKKMFQLIFHAFQKTLL